MRKLGKDIHKLKTPNSQINMKVQEVKYNNFAFDTPAQVYVAPAKSGLTEVPSNDGNSAAESSIKNEVGQAVAAVAKDETIKSEEIVEDHKQSSKTDTYTEAGQNRESADDDAGQYTSIEQTITSNVHNATSAPPITEKADKIADEAEPTPSIKDISIEVAEAIVEKGDDKNKMRSLPDESYSMIEDNLENEKSNAKKTIDESIADDTPLEHG